jgi:hypothetical protein
MVSGLAIGPSRRVGLWGRALLQAMQKIRCALGVGRCAEDHALVVLQDLD